ncbi:unnamed protein product [Durusdinium trenchii]
MYLAGEVHSEVVEALDARLLACHDVLLEDLSEPLLEGFLQDVKRFQSPNEVVGGGMDQVREELYGPTALPILTSDAKAKACFSGAEPRRRQLVIVAGAQPVTRWEAELAPNGGGVKQTSGRAVRTVGSAWHPAVQMERYHLDAKINLKDDPGGQQWKQRWRQAAYTDARRTVQFGSCLADMLIEYAEVDLAAHQVASSSTSASPRLVKAFNHRLRREGKKKVGVVSLDPQVRAMVDEVGLWRFIHPKHKPMILPPAPWRPGGFRPQGPYLIHKVEFVRTNAQQLTNLPSYNPTSVARVMDFLGQVPWKVNGRILRLMRQASIFYGADEYLEELKKKYAHDHEIAAMKNLLPGEADPNAAGVAQSQDKMLKVEKDNENRSLKTKRLFPTANKPDPMPQNLAFLFTKITPEQMMYMWNVLTAIFIGQVLMVIAYCGALATLPDYWWTCTLLFGIPFSYIAIQQIYIDHDVMHGATFPVYDWQKYLTHPFADFFSLPWEEFVLEHNRHHASTVDLLIQGEFGWDPEEFHYALQQWAGPFSTNWYKYILTVPWIPVIHFFGLNDTGSLFALEWWMHFPDEGAGGKCNKDFWNKWVPRRLYHNAFVVTLWALVWLLGTYPLGRPLSEGWRFMFTVSFFARIGFSAAWMFITNFTHSLPWNEFLAQDPGRTWPILHNVMALVLGGKHRWNEMLFHDVHHAFPNAVGTLSQRGRFHGWEKVHDAAAEVLHRGLWKPNGDEETQMQKTQKKRSLMMKSGVGQGGRPAAPDQQVPKLPAEDEELTDAERKDRRIRHFNAQRLCRELQSERPTFELKLQVAEEFLHAEKVYFPHNVDFRGRSYPIPPHLNHIGDDVSRGLLQFAEGKALGPEGLFWLKVNLANLFGKNKVSLEDRAAWVDAQRETIVKVVKDPLKAENVEWWSKADDGPWQALARCFELEEIWASPRPQEYISHLPVHMDGSCNGLQHYAALGRDVKGGEAVNLVPAEKPQDVYTVVLNVVKRKVQEDADSTDESKEVKRVKARRLQELDVLQRKVVKQTIMTICYGVTRATHDLFEYAQGSVHQPEEDDDGIIFLPHLRTDPAMSEAQARALLTQAERHNDEEESKEAEAKAEEALRYLRSTPEAIPGPADAVRILALVSSSRGERKAALQRIAAERALLKSPRAQAVLTLAFAEIANSRCGSKRREEALKAALEAVEAFRSLGEQRMEGWALVALAHTHVQRGTKSEIPEELDRALDAASQAEELLRAVGDRVGEGKALHTIAVALSFQNEVDEAVARSWELVSYWRDLGYRRLEAFQQECVSEWELARHRPEEALEAAQAALEQKALREAQETADVRMPSRSAAALIHASNAYLTMGMTEEALKLSKERLEVFQKNADFESEVVAQSSIVSVYVNSDRLQEAADVAEETLRKIRKRSSTRLLKCWESDLLQTLAKIYLKAEDAERAEHTIDQAMKLADEQKDRKSLAACYLLQSELALLKKENRLGLKAAMKSRDLSRKTGTKKGEASALLQLCSAYCARGELKRGAAVTVEAQRIFNSVADREGEADALRMQAEVRMHLNDFTRAIAASRRCRELQREMGDRKSEAWACIQLAQTLLSAASEEEKQEMDRRAKAKEEKAKNEGKVLEEKAETDWFQAETQVAEEDEERPARAAFERALQSAKDALHISRPLEDDQLLVRALLSLATAHMMSLEPEDSHKCIDEGMPLAQTVSDSSAEGHFFLLKAQLAEFDGAKGYPQAKEFANEALKLFQMQHDESGEAAVEAILKRITPKTVGVRPTNTGGVSYFAGEGEEMEEYWEEEVYEEIVGGGPVAGGQGQVQPYSGPTKEEVVSVVSDVALGLIGVESLDNDEPLMDAGLDSLAAVEFGNTLAREFSGIALPSTMMFDFPSVKLLSEFIESSMRENHEKAQASLQNAPSGAGAGQVVKRTRMVKKFRPKPRAARQAPPRQMQFNQVAEPIQIVQPMMQGGTMGGAPAASQQLASGPGPYKGRG